MTREVMTRAFGWKNLAAAGVLLVTLLAGALAARQRAIEGVRAAARGVTPTASQSEVLRSGSWLRTVEDGRGSPVVDVQLDRVLDELGLGVVLDRPALSGMLQAVVGADPQIEEKRVGDVFGRVARIRINSQGMSVVIGRRVVMQTLQHVKRAGDRAAAGQQCVAQLRDRRVGRVAHQQVAQDAAGHRRKRVPAGVEAAQVVGVGDLLISRHAPSIAVITQITQISVMSQRPDRRSSGARPRRSLLTARASRR